ncbi:hypothetical protein [Bacillus sp. JCM 19041]|uniref:hypothetical protein n=1 Tax=Bacillus sp. JCM 19041 TaxID=1460637 RepID=UPI000A7BF00D
MQKWMVEQLGDPKEALVLRTDEERPVRKKGQVLIRTEAAALNFFDILLCQALIKKNLRCLLRWEQKLQEQLQR